ncbi:MAG: hypothetical protein Q7K71_01820 [Candidatus Omnitrophota bacterium]|nr:hypothetical protein [Candidatus Omnitrophota bacterium]
MFVIDDARREYMSRQIGDLGKNILTAAVASYFFEKFSLLMRFGLCILGLGFMVAGVLIQPSKKGA